MTKKNVPSTPVKLMESVITWAMRVTSGAGLGFFWLRAFSTNFNSLDANGVVSVVVALVMVSVVCCFIMYASRPFARAVFEMKD